MENTSKFRSFDVFSVQAFYDSRFLKLPPCSEIDGVDEMIGGPSC